MSGGFDAEYLAYKAEHDALVELREKLHQLEVMKTMNDQIREEIVQKQEKLKVTVTLPEKAKK